MANAEAGARNFSARTTGYIVNDDGTILTPKRAVISASSSGATQVVAAVTGKKIRVISLVVIIGGAANVKFQSNDGSATDITGLLPLAANGGFSAGVSELGHFETASGARLDINLSAAVTAGGFMTYVEA